MRDVVLVLFMLFRSLGWGVWFWYCLCSSEVLDEWRGLCFSCLVAGAGHRPEWSVLLASQKDHTAIRGLVCADGRWLPQDRGPADVFELTWVLQCCCAGRDVYVVCVCVYVCVCVCVREREHVCVYMCVCVCVHVREREHVCVCERGYISHCFSVCVKGESRVGEKSTFVKLDHYAAAEAKCKACFTSDGLKCYSFNISWTWTFVKV